METTPALGVVEDVYRRFNEAINDSVPAIKQSKFFPKPWWNAQVQKMYNARERAYKAYRTRKSPANFVRWKQLRAEHRRNVKQHKQMSWEKMAGEINCNTPIAKVWESIRRIKGRTPKKIPILTDGNQMITTVPEIGEKLAQTFSRISSCDNYSPHFKLFKASYNQPFSFAELQYAIKRTKETCPGPDI